MLLGTPNISLDVGIPDWLLAIILLSVVLIYYIVNRLYKRYKKRIEDAKINEDIID